MQLCNEVFIEESGNVYSDLYYSCLDFIIKRLKEELVKKIFDLVF